MAHYCEYPIFLSGESWSRECGEIACTKFMNTWLCVLHEEPGMRRLAEAAKEAFEEESLDDLS